MPHGQPDYGMYQLARTIYRLTDMGELAARLGSIDTFDRRGDVIWLDDFEDGITKWYNGTPDGGYVVTSSSEHSRNGLKSAKATFPAGATVNQTLEHWQPYPVLSKIGFEVSFTIHADLDFIEIYNRAYDGTNYLQGIIRYNVQTLTLEYQDSAGVMQTLDTAVYLYPKDYLFHTAKLVMDFANGLYSRLILNETSYDLSAYALRQVGSGINKHLYTFLNMKNFNDAAVAIYIDDAILTQNEP